jgi:ribonuclease BN (tRNA processing enzyme)
MAQEERRPPGPPPSFSHKQPFSVITLGTGSPKPNLQRASASTMIQCKGKYYVLDTGNNSGLSFIKGKYSYKDIRAILFTHLHADHSTDYFNIMIDRWMTGGKAMELIGPPRTGQLHTFLLEFFADDLTYRMLRGQARGRGVNKVGMSEGVNIRELIGANELSLDGMKITTAEMTHTMYNLAYRFDFNGQSIVVSGDTSFDQDLISLSKDADILVMDGNVNQRKRQAQEQAAKVFTEKSKKPEPAYKYAGNFDVPPHVTMEDMIKIASEAKVKKLVLTHFPPVKFDEAKVRKMIKDGGYNGEVIFGVDALEINP